MISFEETSTRVPIDGGQSVTIDPKQPWPSAYRGSRYSLVSHDDFSDDVVKWKQRDLSIFAEPPKGLRRAMILAGKSGGGSFRVTAQGEVITKIEADDYSNLDQAPVSEGWIPVYLGKLTGSFDFGVVDSNPPKPAQDVAIWRGFPFNHGERWAVDQNEDLIWTWRDYRFKSAFNHDELVRKYDQYRPNPGRLYITEHGHVWVNVPNDDVEPGKQQAIEIAIKRWRRKAEENDDAATLRLVNRRLVATSDSDDPADGHLPVHLGHLRDFDDGTVPRPVVDDETYFAQVGKYEQAWG